MIPSSAKKHATSCFVESILRVKSAPGPQIARHNILPPTTLGQFRTGHCVHVFVPSRIYQTLCSVARPNQRLGLAGCGLCLPFDKSSFVFPFPVPYAKVI
eukprot:TRINITY_DN13655_c0_g1_i1.p1 TRINITY_DN13655_c0_g1~~TRINITY_DN13655_c0_g1_i1.p1  ORF type:complete len:100 (-),score=0.08 TRINITY_DN13655_c0_g1_i1:107-406(-)